MRPLRYSINVTLDGCCHHEAGLPPHEDSMHYWTAQMQRADALIFGRVTYEMMQSGLIDEYEFLVQPVVAGHGPTLLAGLRERIHLEPVDRHEFRSGAVALLFRPTRAGA